jgi:hypothetical protein
MVSAFLLDTNVTGFYASTKRLRMVGGFFPG